MRTRFGFFLLLVSTLGYAEHSAINNAVILHHAVVGAVPEITSNGTLTEQEWNDEMSIWKEEVEARTPLKQNHRLIDKEASELLNSVVKKYAGTRLRKMSCLIKKENIQTKKVQYLIREDGLYFSPAKNEGKKGIALRMAGGLGVDNNFEDFKNPYKRPSDDESGRNGTHSASATLDTKNLSLEGMHDTIIWDDGQREIHQQGKFTLQTFTGRKSGQAELAYIYNGSISDKTGKPEIKFEMHCR